ncbi:MAG: hypothetical protein WCY84_00155 [Candidatus Cloacimonadaceae bacterium]
MSEAYSWASKVREYQAMEADIPESRITAFALLGVDTVRGILGASVYDDLWAAKDKRLEFAVCALAISDLLKSSRQVNEGSSIHDVQGWGTGEIRSSEISEILRLSKSWEERAHNALAQLKRDYSGFAGWIDL